jgi:hypothetical protein
MLAISSTTGRDHTPLHRNDGLRPFPGQLSSIRCCMDALQIQVDIPKQLVLLSITAEHAEALGDFPELTRHDPFDRLLVAQASRTGLQLLTAD